MCGRQVCLKDSTTLELKPKAPAEGGSGASSSSTASKAKATTSAPMKLVVPESVYAPIPAERQAELKNSVFKFELVSDRLGGRGGLPYSRSSCSSSAAALMTS